MSLADSTYEILAEEVRRTLAKQKAGDLELEDVRKLEIVIKVASNIYKAAPPAQDPMDSLSEDELLKFAGGTQKIEEELKPYRQETEHGKSDIPQRTYFFEEKKGTSQPSPSPKPKRRKKNKERAS